MGNRAVIAFTGPLGDGGNGSVFNHTACVYLHWNGGRASVEGFLGAARHLGYTALTTAAQRRDAFARMAQAWFGTGSVCVGPYFQQDVDNGDNGTYVVDAELNIVERRFVRGEEEFDGAKTEAIRLECIAVAGALGRDGLADVRLVA